MTRLAEASIRFANTHNPLTHHTEYGATVRSRYALKPGRDGIYGLALPGRVLSCFAMHRVDTYSLQSGLLQTHGISGVAGPARHHGASPSTRRADVRVRSRGRGKVGRLQFKYDKRVVGTTASESSFGSIRGIVREASRCRRRRARSPGCGRSPRRGRPGHGTRRRSRRRTSLRLPRDLRPVARASSIDVVHLVVASATLCASAMPPQPSTSSGMPMSVGELLAAPEHDDDAVGLEEAVSSTSRSTDQPRAS